jgi:prepilin-type N-terminal cleavage/methylation domain-containing protein
MGLLEVAMKNRHTQTGFSLFEILVVVGISAIALAGLFQIGYNIQVKNQTASTERLVSTIVNEATSYQKLNGSYAALNCALNDMDCYFVQHKLIAENQTNAFGGKIFINSQGDEQIKVSIQRIPARACEHLLLSFNQNPKLKGIELLNPLQEGTTDNVTNPDDPPPEECTVQVGFAKTVPDYLRYFKLEHLSPISTAYAEAGAPPKPPKNCTVPGMGTFSVTSIDQFPVSPVVAAELCSASTSYTMAWTFE